MFSSKVCALNLVDFVALGSSLFGYKSRTCTRGSLSLSNVYDISRISFIDPIIVTTTTMLAHHFFALLLATLAAARVQPRETPSPQNPHPVRALVDRSLEPRCDDPGVTRTCVRLI